MVVLFPLKSKSDADGNAPVAEPTEIPLTYNFESDSLSDLYTQAI